MINRQLIFVVTIIDGLNTNGVNYAPNASRKNIPTRRETSTIEILFYTRNNFNIIQKPMESFYTVGGEI